MPRVTLPGVDLIAAGSWPLSSGDETFTRDDLANALDAAQCPAVGDPVIKLGHVDPRFDGTPALGRVRNMRLADQGMKIQGDLTGLPPWLGEVAASAYPHRSIEGQRNFTCQIGHRHPFVITGLALLGVTAPGVGVLRSLDDVKQLVTAAAGGWWSQAQGDNVNEADRILDAHVAIMAAAGRGAVSPDGALRWAYRAERGEDVASTLPLLAGVPELRDQVAASANLSSQVMDALCGRTVKAHSHQQALQQAHEALDRGHQANYSEDEFASLFPPSAPLGPDGEGHEDAPRSHGQVQHGDGMAASASDDDAELFRRLYGRYPMPGEFR